MFKQDPFENIDPKELEELSEAVREEDAAEVVVDGLSCLHEIIDEVAEQVTSRNIVGVVLFDASNLGAWERQHGASAFDTVIGRLAKAVIDLRGESIRSEDQICFEWPRGDSLLVFLSKPRMDDDAKSAAVDFEEIVERLERDVFDPSHDAQLWLHEAFEKVATGSALIIHNSSVDARREVYRAIRRARSDAHVNHLERQRKRHRVVGHMIAHRKIDTLYQPIVNMATREVVGYEALSRAENAEAERLGVHLFVAAAKAELDGELDQTCRSLSVTRRPGLEQKRMLFINSLPPTFYPPMEELEVLLDSWIDDGLAPEQLVFEITENITHEQAQRILPSVKRLRKRGFRFALDDVGTGTTNLRLIADLEPDFIKMDITLTRGIGQSQRKQALARYLIELGDKCNARLVAEGIETEDDHETLVDLGFDLGQGFLLGRPESRDKVESNGSA
jgi:EAL domain-containing protein (putative c-di-GMP-specific phosphodiesterase class I)